MPESAIEQNLARGRLEQVGAAHHFRDAHGRVVGHAGELIAGNAVAPPDDEVAEVHAGHKTLRTEIQVDELDHLAVGNAEAPVRCRRESSNSLAVGPGSCGVPPMKSRQVPG